MKTNMMKWSKLFALAVLYFSFAACNQSDDSVVYENPLQAYDNGIFMLNEGNFGTPNASVSFISNDLLTFQDNIFFVVNPTKVLGDVAQSMGFYNEKAYIVVNTSNKIEIVNRHSFATLGTITDGLALPRYVVALNGKIYVTNSSNNTVTVYDADTFAKLATIAINKTVEKIVAVNGKIYVMNASFGTGSEITVINPATNTVTATLQVGDGLNSIEAKGNTLYALSGADSASKLVKINTQNDQITGTVTFPATLVNARNMDIDGEVVYFTKGNGVYRMGINDTTVSDTSIFTVPDNDFSTFYGFAAINGKIYVSDAKGFVNKSAVTIYSSAGTVLSQKTTGIGTNGFYPNN